MTTKQKTWVVLCLQDTPLTEYSSEAEATAAAQASASSAVGARGFLVYELVGGFSPVNDANPITVV